MNFWRGFVLLGLVLIFARFGFGHSGPTLFDPAGSVPTFTGSYGLDPFDFLLGPQFQDVEPYPDVPTNHWAYRDIMNLKKEGIMIGYPDGTFFGGSRK